MEYSQKVLVADSQLLSAEGFATLLERSFQEQLDIVNIVNSGFRLFQQMNLTKIDILFMDISFHDMDGMDIINRVKNDYPSTKICVLSAYTDHKIVKKAFLSGTDGFYSKTNNSEELQKCVSDLLAGNTFLSEGLHITPPQRREDEVEHNGKKVYQDKFMIQQKLTKREQEVLNLITKALNNKEIADRLYISHQTVGVHRKNIMRKLGVRNTVNLIRFALDHQLI